MCVHYQYFQRAPTHSHSNPTLSREPPFALSLVLAWTSELTNNLINHARETEPEAFVLQIFFNAHPIGGDPKQKPKATNVLVPTSVAYAGGYVDFPVDMGSEVCLRPLPTFPY